MNEKQAAHEAASLRIGPFHVCPDCEGTGSKDSIGPFTRDNLDEWYGDTPEREDFLRDYMAGAYNKVCGYCKGQRVVNDEDFEAWADEVQYRAEIAAEQRMGA